MFRTLQLTFLAVPFIIYGCGTSDKSNTTGDSGIPDAGSKVRTEVMTNNSSGDPEVGKSAYMTCASCHGQKAEGMKALNAPALANQEPYYLKQQINNFRSDLRGKHPDDIYGAQMLPMAKTLVSDEMADNVIAYIKTLGPVTTVQTLEGGDAEAGKTYYQMVCGACHGPGAKGNESLHSPRLVGMEDWYVKRQLENFKAGVRGAEQGDLYGSQMLQIANAIPDDKTVLDLTAYFHSLQGE